MELSSASAAQFLAVTFLATIDQMMVVMKKKAEGSQIRSATAIVNLFAAGRLKGCSGLIRPAHVHHKTAPHDLQQ